MSVPTLGVLQRYLRRLRDEAAPAEDAVLLNRFVTAHDCAAFEQLMARHGPMVLGTARRLVDNPHDAEDVFQAVFLSLARLAKSIRQGKTLPTWLHKTTCRVAVKCRANRLVLSAPPPERYEQCDPGAGLVWREVCQALDEELQRLPERLRLPLLLCYLSGLTRDEAARQLGCSLGTLKRRLEEGRQTLRVRLAKRGIASVGLVLAVLTPEALQAAVSKSLLDASLRLIFSAGTVVPATISTLVLSSATAMKGLAMKSIIVVFAAIVLGVGIYAGMGQADLRKTAEGKREEVKPAQEDKGVPPVPRDDPLPAGSTLRFGTSRFRHGIPVAALAISPDGKMAFVANGDHMEGISRVFDLATGRMISSLANMNGIEGGAFSPDGQTLVTKDHSDLSIRDAATGKVLRTIQGPRTTRSGPSMEWSGGIKFTPDGKVLVMTSQGKFLHLIDFESGKTIRDISIDNPESALSSSFGLVNDVAFSPDGKLMASGGYDNVKNNYFARLWNVETGKELRRFMHGTKGYGIGCLAFSPDGKTLATLGTQSSPVLRFFDVDTGKKRREFPEDGDFRTAGGSVAFSPDGKTVAAAGASIRFYDTATGVERLRIDQRASNLHFTDGGKTLTAAVRGAICRWDTASGKLLTPEAADSVVQQILVTADGTRVFTRGQDGEAHIWDGTNGKHLQKFRAGQQRSLALSPDGRFLACPVVDPSFMFSHPQVPHLIYRGSRIRLYDIAADQFVNRFPGLKADVQDLAFTNDGQKLVTLDQFPGRVRIWNFENGKEERSFEVRPNDLEIPGFHFQRTQLSPDGKMAVVTCEENIRGTRALGFHPRQLFRLWDVATGKQITEPSGGFPLNNVLSPNGQVIATSGEPPNRVVKVISPDGRYLSPTGENLVFSRDGRFLAIIRTDGLIQIWEVATWTKRNEFQGHRDRPSTLAFAPGGQLLSGSFDTTVLAWEMRPRGVAGSVSLESAWNDLAAKGSDISFKSEGRFLAAPAEVVKFFAAKIKPPEALDPKRIGGLLADLDNGEFSLRERASKTLQELDEQAQPYLEKALKSAESLEVRRRVEMILAQRQAAGLSSEQIRQIRGVMILELIDDDHSRNLLKTWAGGPAGALLTEEAAAAFKRLAGTAKAKR